MSHSSLTPPRALLSQALAAARRFAAAFQSALDTDPAIRTAATAPLATGLAEGFAAADRELGAVLSPDHASLAFIGAGGYRQWLAGPEDAVRRLVADSIRLYRDPTEAAASNVRAALLLAADAAAASLPEGTPEHLQEQLRQLATDSIGGWQAGALGQLRALLTAEMACPDNESFAALQQQLCQLLSTPPEEREEPAPAAPATAAALPAKPEPAAPEELQASPSCPCVALPPKPTNNRTSYPSLASSVAPLLDPSSTAVLDGRPGAPHQQGQVAAALVRAGCRAQGTAVHACEQPGWLVAINWAGRSTWRGTASGSGSCIAPWHMP